MGAITTELRSGWKCKQVDDDSENAWLPVSKVPTAIHLDLQENGKYVLILLIIIGQNQTHISSQNPRPIRQHE